MLFCRVSRNRIIIYVVYYDHNYILALILFFTNETQSLLKRTPDLNLNIKFKFIFNKVFFLTQINPTFFLKHPIGQFLISFLSLSSHTSLSLSYSSSIYYAYCMRHVFPSTTHVTHVKLCITKVPFFSTKLIHFYFLND